MSTTIHDPAIQALMAKDLLRELLPRKVIMKIRSCSEEYMIERMLVGLKVQFANKLWSPALLLDDSASARAWGTSLKKRARNADEFVTWCLMMYEAGEEADDD